MVRLTDRPDMTLDVYRGRKTTIQQSHHAIGVLCPPPVFGYSGSGPGYLCSISFDIEYLSFSVRHMGGYIVNNYDLDIFII